MAYNDIADAILALVPNGEFTITGNTYAGVTWLSTDENIPSFEQVNTKLAELAAAEPMRLLREKRDELLAETDWWVLPDVNVTPAQLAYRQALRDLPATTAALTDPSTVVFPAKPTTGGTR